MTVTGDGRPENEFVFVGEKLWKESAMLKLTKNIPTPSPIKESRELLKEKIFRYFHWASYFKYRYVVLYFTKFKLL